MKGIFNKAGEDIFNSSQAYELISTIYPFSSSTSEASLGLTQHVGVLRGLIQSRLKLGKWKDRLIKDPTRIMEAYLGCTQAIGHNAGVI